jgi:hypothetical protein
MKQNFTELKGKMSNSIIMGDYFNTPFLILKRTIR